MAHSKEKRAQARSLYVHQRLALATIALQLGISTATISRWKSAARSGGDDWDISRSATAMAGEGFDKLVSNAVENFTILFQATMDGINHDSNLTPSDKAKLMAGLADSFNKMINAAGRASPKLSKLSIAITILKMQADFVQEHFPNHANVFQEILEPFGLEVAKAFHEGS